MVTTVTTVSTVTTVTTVANVTSVTTVTTFTSVGDKKISSQEGRQVDFFCKGGQTDRHTNQPTNRLLELLWADKRKEKC